MIKLTDKDYQEAAAHLKCQPAAIKAVAEVESGKSGFFPDDTPSTLFEGHWFYKLTGGAYAGSYPTICYPSYTKQFYGKTWQQEKARLKLAQGCDLDAALQSASWGRFQIMGFNWNTTGHRSLYEFCSAMRESEYEQLMAFVNFVDFMNLEDEIQRQDWRGFARVYNGPKYMTNNYPAKMAAAFLKHGGVA